MPLHTFRELTEAVAAAEKFLSELKSTFGKLLAQAMGKVPTDSSQLSALYAEYDAAKKKYDSEIYPRRNRTMEGQSERRALEDQEKLLETYVEEIKKLEKLFPMPPAQGDSSSGVGGGQGADAVTLSP